MYQKYSKNKAAPTRKRLCLTQEKITFNSPKMFDIQIGGHAFSNTCVSVKKPFKDNFSTYCPAQLKWWLKRITVYLSENKMR